MPASTDNDKNAERETPASAPAMSAPAEPAKASKKAATEEPAEKFTAEMWLLLYHPLSEKSYRETLAVFKQEFAFVPDTKPPDSEVLLDTNEGWAARFDEFVHASRPTHP